ncbi:hypothetical protein [Streptomyces sp. NPDC048636]
MRQTGQGPLDAVHPAGRELTPDQPPHVTVHALRDVRLGGGEGR